SNALRNAMARRAENQRSVTARPDQRGARGAPASVPAPGHAAADFDLERHLFYWFTKVLSRRDRLLAAELKSFGLRAAEWRVVTGLRGGQRWWMSGMADVSSIGEATWGRRVDRMVEAGWVVRLAGADDMRVRRLALTPEGHALFGRLW